MNQTLVSISCLLLLAVYVSAKQYKYEVSTWVKSAHKTKGKMWITFKPCLFCSKVTVGPLTIGNQESDTEMSDTDSLVHEMFESYEWHVDLDVPDANLSGASFYWEASDSNQNAMIEVSFIGLWPFNSENKIVYGKGKTCKSHNPYELIPSGKQVSFNNCNSKNV